MNNYMEFDISTLNNKKCRLLQTEAVEFFVIKRFLTKELVPNKNEFYEILTENQNTFIFHRNKFILKNVTGCELIAELNDTGVLLYNNEYYNNLIKNL